MAYQPPPPGSQNAESIGDCRYELLHVVRTHMGSSDASYGCVFQKEDLEGNIGVFLSKELMSIAGHALKANITTLGPLVLPLSEQILFFLNLIARKVRSPHPLLQDPPPPIITIHPGVGVCVCRAGELGPLHTYCTPISVYFDKRRLE